MSNALDAHGDLRQLKMFDGHPLLSLMQLLTYRRDPDRTGAKRGYYLAADGACWMIYQLAPFERDTLSAEACAAASQQIRDVLNALPEGTSAQIMRYKHSDISPEITEYAYEQVNYPPTSDFAEAIRNSVVQRQIDGATTGFFGNVDDASLQAAQEEAVSEASQFAGADPDFSGALSEAIEESKQQGRFARKTELYLAFRYTPEWVTKRMKVTSNALRLIYKALTGKREDESIKAQYAEGIKEFFDVLSNFEQAMIEQGKLRPQRVHVQGLIRLLYRELNPRRYFDEVPDDGLGDIPTFNPDLTIREQVFGDGAQPQSDIAETGMWSSVTMYDQGWQIDDLYHRPVSLGGCPSYVGPRMLDKRLLENDFDGWVVMNIDCLKRWRMKSLMYMRKQMFELVQGVKSYITPGSSQSEVAAERREHFTHMMNSVEPELEDSVNALNTSLHLVLRGRDWQTLERQTTQWEHALWRKGTRENLHGSGVMHACVPGNMRPAVQRATQRDIPMLANDVAEMVPVYDGFGGSRSSTSIMLNNTEGTPIFMDFWDDDVTAPHGLVLGGTGSGKSFAVQNLLQQLSAKERVKTFIIDKGASFQDTVLAQGGDYIHLQLNAPTDHAVCINPFYLPPDGEGNPRTPADDELEFMIATLISMAKTGTGEGVELHLDKADRNACSTMLTDLFNERYERLVEMQQHDPDGYRAIAYTDQLQLGRDIMARMMDYELLQSQYGEDFAARGTRFADVISDYTKQHGVYGDLFDGDLSLEWEKDILGFETGEVAELPCFSTVMMVLFYQISNFCKHRLPPDMKKMIVMDECWSGLADPAIAGRLAAWIYEMRKFGTSVLLITQSLTQLKQLLDAEARAGGKSGGLLNNICHFITLSCTSADHRLGPRILEMTNEEVAAWSEVASLPPYFTEFLYRYRSVSGEFVSGKVRLYSNPVSLWLSTTAPGDKGLRTRYTQFYRDRGYDARDASRMAIEELARVYPFGSKFPPKGTPEPEAESDAGAAQAEAGEQTLETETADEAP